MYTCRSDGQILQTVRAGCDLFPLWIGSTHREEFQAEIEVLDGIVLSLTFNLALLILLHRA